MTLPGFKSETTLQLRKLLVVVMVAPVAVVIDEDLGVSQIGCLLRVEAS